MKKKRPPIVVILGSVDHGKTTLLDHIRKTNIADRESGGITQSIGAYEIVHNGEKITFIDTPGHAAFTAMRTRGCRCADIGVLVVAADDGVKPQTKESIATLKKAALPFVVAINKIDRPGASAEKVKTELTQAQVLLEGHGGNISYQEISAKTGKGVNELLDLILLTAEVEELTFEPSGPLQGFIIESHLDKRQGMIASTVIKNGTIEVGDEIHAGQTSGKVKSLVDFTGHRLQSATASSPVQILGLATLPKVGDTLGAGATTVTPAAPPEIIGETNDANRQEESFGLILRADVSGSLEALNQIIAGISAGHHASQDNYPLIRIIDQGVGEINDGDVKLAVSTKAVVVGFRTKVSKAAENVARAQEIKIINSDIIYDLIKEIELMLESRRERAVTGRLKILRNFGEKDNYQIIGGQVTEGLINNKSALEIMRNETMIGLGTVVNLQKDKGDVTTVAADHECGLLFDSKTLIRINDILIAH